MKRLLYFIFLFAFINSYSQDDSIAIKTPQKAEATATKVFYSQKVINTKTVQVLPKGILEFNVSHNFGDVGGENGGIQKFYGLDNSTDVRIGFQVGLGNKLNLVAARAKGLYVTQLWELGLKYQFLHQVDNDPQHPLSLTMYVNDVVSTQPRSDPRFGETRTSFENFGDRHSQIVQVMLAKKFGKTSLQFNPLYLHTNLVAPYDQENIFALGGAIRLPLSKKIILLADYFHPFRTQLSSDSLGKFYDPIGIGFEIVTEGHVFHLNFTNATEILENQFTRYTKTSWSDKEFRWAFTISRNFVLFRDKKKTP